MLTPARLRCIADMMDEYGIAAAVGIDTHTPPAPVLNVDARAFPAGCEDLQESEWFVDPKLPGDEFQRVTGEIGGVRIQTFRLRRVAA